MDINKIKDLIRIGRVSSINPLKCTAKVTFPDKDDMVSDELPILTIGTNKTKAYFLPAIDTQVLCIFLPNNSGKGINDGFILGCIYSDEDMPVENNEKVVSINFDDGSYIRFDNGNIEIYGSKTVKITAPKIDINI